MQGLGICRTTLWALAAFVRSPRLWGLWLLGALMLATGQARAATSVVCGPYTVSVASGGSVTIDATACDTGFGLNGGDASSTYGTIAYNNLSNQVTYTNTVIAGGAVQDHFQFLDGDSGTVAVTVNIAAPTSSIAIAPSTLPAPQVGVAYNQTLTASGGAGPYTIALTSGSLPPGLNFSGGTISGTPTTGGSYSVTFTATDNTSASGTKSYAITVPSPTITIPTTLPNPAINTPYNQALSATGGTGPYTYSLETGSLPAGLSLSPGGVISGTPTTLQTSTFTIRATDSSAGGPYFGATSFTVTVQNQPPVANPVSATVAYGSSANPITLNITGGTPASVAVGTAPAHGTATASGTSITYTPTAGYAGSDSFTYTATNGSGTSAPATASITVSPPTLSYTPANPPAGTAGVPYSQSLTGASGGAMPYTYAVTSGALPAGLTLASNGTLSGTPTAAGTFNFRVTATDSSTGTGPFSVTSGNLTLVIAPPTVSVLPPALPAATVGTAYAQTLIGAGGTAPYTFAMSAGALPAGLALSSSGALSGTPTAGGAFNFTVTATDSTSGGTFAGSRAYTFNVNAPTLALSPAPGSLSGSAGVPYSQTFTASGGTPSYSYSLTVNSGTLPTGLSFSTSTGTLSGTPTSAGTAGFTITATDSSTGSGPYTVSGSYTLTVAAPTVTLSPASLPAPVVGVGYSQNVSAAGGSAPYNYAVTAGSLPAGLTLASDGSLSGTPTAGGTYNFTITATDAHSFTGSRAYSVTLAAASITLDPATLPGVTAEAAYSQALTASGGTAPYTYSLSAGSLPPGMALSSGGALSGTPTAAGTFTFTVRATDSSTGTGAPFTGSRAYSLTVAAPTITLAPASLPAMQVGTAYSQALTASGGTGGYTFSLAAGALPPGVALSSVGLLSGTPVAAGTYNFTVTAHDGLGFTGSQAYTLSAGAASISLSPASLPGGTAESAYAQTIVASGGIAPYSYALSGGSLPPGVALSSSGTLSGTPTAAGTFTFTVRATDSSTGSGAPFSATRSYSVTIGAPAIAVTPAALPALQVAAPFNQPLAASGGDGSYTFSLAAGALPAGIGLSSAGVLSGTPTAAGSFTFTVSAQDGHGFTGSQAYTVNVAAPTLALGPATLPAGMAEAAYAQSLTATGGVAPYAYSVSAGALPAGLSLNAATGQLSGTPSAAGSFSFTVRVTDSSTGAGAPFNATHSYTVSIGAPAITVTPATLPGGQAAVAYHQQLAASGGDGSYAFSVSAGTLPAGLSLSAAGLLAGTPGAAGSYSFTITATDGLHFTGSQAYTVAVAQPVPVAQNDNFSMPADAPATIAVTANDAGPIASIAIAQAPAHGSASVNGLDVVYTPATNYYGSDTLTYTAIGPGGTSVPATVSVTVTPLAVPTAAAQAATVLAGQAVTIHAAAGATGGPFTALHVVDPPSTGQLAVNGTDIVYTPAADATGTIGFDYTLSNAFGASAPARITLTVNPLPVPAALSAEAVAGTTVHMDLTAGARGGPFTGARVLSVSPSNAGTASVRATATGYRLDFTASATFSGAAQLGYTLSNAYATSAPGSITVSVTARSDPSKNAEVLGILEAQADATRRMAIGQIGNFQRRLESLHGGAAAIGGFSNGITFSSAGARQQRDPLRQGPTAGDDWERLGMVQPDAAAAPPSGERAGSASLPGDVSIWTGGAVNFGKSQPGSSDDGIDFTTSGVSVGADKRVSEALALGIGLGYGHDTSDIGRNTSRSTVDSYNLALYASYRPFEAVYADALVGYQWLSFDARRYVTDNGNTVRGSRDGKQLFGSFSLSYEHRSEGMLLSPYGRLDIARAHLDGYTEHGDEVFALAYRGQTVKTSTGTLGLRAQWSAKRDYGMWLPQLRVEFGHDFQGSSQAVMRYADLLDGPLYRATLNNQSRNHTLLGAGLQLQLLRGWLLRFEYQNLLDNSSRDNQSVLLGAEKKL